MNLSIIVAIDEAGAIGNEQQLLCCLPNDMKHFREITTGHTVIMGRKTFDSLPKGALPNRKNIVLSKQKNVHYENVQVFGSLEDALSACSGDDEIFIIGGGSVYKQALPYADKIYMTKIHHIFEHADVFFPDIQVDNKWYEVEYHDFDKDENHYYPYSFYVYKKK